MASTVSTDAQNKNKREQDDDGEAVPLIVHTENGENDSVPSSNDENGIDRHGQETTTTGPNTGIMMMNNRNRPLRIAVDRLQKIKFRRRSRRNSTAAAAAAAAGSGSSTTRNSVSDGVVGAASLQTSEQYQQNQEAVPLIENLDRVVFGTVAAAEVIRICGLKPPQYLWYMLSGACCDVIQFTMDYLMHTALGVEDASTCWTVCFTLSIVFRHTFHRYLVFGNYVGGYWNSLLRMYGGYSVSIVLSGVFNMAITKMGNASHYIAFVFTILWTGVVNFFVLKRLWSFGGKTGNKGNATTNNTTTTTTAAAGSATSATQSEILTNAIVASTAAV